VDTPYACRAKLSAEPEAMSGSHPLRNAVTDDGLVHLLAGRDLRMACSQNTMIQDAEDGTKMRDKRED
jgi:hypothetical protein